jgi:hypothetical protein
VKLKNGERRELSAFSTLGPSDVLDVASLTRPTDKLFDEKIQINRIELSDGNVLQRNDWKYAEVKSGVDKVTSTPWGNDTCRAL